MHETHQPVKKMYDLSKLSPQIVDASELACISSNVLVGCIGLLIFSDHSIQWLAVGLIGLMNAIMCMRQLSLIIDFCTQARGYQPEQDHIGHRRATCMHHQLAVHT